MVVGYLPRRYFIGECLQNGIFPLWNPYGEGGYPIYANLISTWSPLNMFTGVLTGYTNLTLHFFFIVHVYMAGLGMFKLINHLIRHRKIAFIIGIAYMLSGIFIGHAQHINFLSGACWLPWVILFYFRLYKKPQITNLLWGTVFVFLMLTDGYPAISIITAYLLFALFIGFSIKKWKNHNWIAIAKWFGINGIFALLIIILVIGQIISLIEVGPHIARFNEVDSVRVFSNPFSFESFLSFILPYSSVGDKWFFQTDTSMSNAYFGLLPLAAVFTGLFMKLPKKAWFFLIIAIITLLTAVGDSLPFRALTFEYLPMMDKFRYPSIFRIFTIFGFLVFAGYALHNIFNNSDRLNRFRIALSGLLIIVLGISIYALQNIDPDSFSIFIKSDKSTLYDRILIQGILQLVLLALFLIVLRRKKMHWGLIIILIIADLMLSVQLNMQSTGVSKKDPIEWYNQIKKHPEGFPVPSRKPIIEQTNKLFSFGPSWKNGSIFRKEISFQGYNPFLLDSYKKLDTTLHIKKHALNNPIIFFSDSLVSDSLSQQGALEPNTLVVESNLFKTLKNTDHKTSNQDTWQISNFSPTKIEVKTKTTHQQIITLQQANYPGWKLYIDGKKSNHFTSNYHFISTVLPAGSHTIIFHFEKNKIIVASIISLSLFLLILVVAILLSLSKQKLIIKIGFSTGIVIIALIASYNFFNKPYNHTRNTIYKKAAIDIKAWQKSCKQTDFSYLFPIDNPFQLKNQVQTKEEIEFSRIYTEKDISNLENNFNKSEKNNLVYFWSNTVNEEELKGWLYFHYPEVKKLKNYQNGQLAWLTRNKRHNNQKRIHINYEKDNLFWNKHKNNVDSTQKHEGRYSLKIGKQEKYGGGFNLKMGDHFNEDHEFIAIRGFSILSKQTNARAVLRFFGKNVEKPIKVKSIKLHGTDSASWNAHYIATKIPAGCTKIHFFYYKQEKESGVLSIDDCNVLLIEDDFLKCGSIEK